MPLALHYRSYGGGPPLIILHGLFGSSNNWHTMATELGGHFLVYAVDQRNHGQSPHSEEFTYGAMAVDLERFLADRGLERTSILGHSMGGKTAMEFALRFPQKVEKLIVVDIAPRAYGRGHDEILEAMVSLDLALYRSREAIDRALQNRIPDERVRQFILTNLKRLAGGHYVWKVNLDVLRAKYEEVTKAQVSAHPFPGSALFIQGGNSDYIREADRALISSPFPRATLRSIAGAGHWVHADSPGEFFRVVLEFLQE